MFFEVLAKNGLQVEGSRLHPPQHSHWQCRIQSLVKTFEGPHSAGCCRRFGATEAIGPAGQILTDGARRHLVKILTNGARQHSVKFLTNGARRHLVASGFVDQWTADSGPVDQCDNGQVDILVPQYVYQWTVDSGPVDQWISRLINLQPYILSVACR